MACAGNRHARQLRPAATCALLGDGLEFIRRRARPKSPWDGIGNPSRNHSGLGMFPSASRLKVVARSIHADVYAVISYYLANQATIDLPDPASLFRRMIEDVTRAM